MHLASLASCKPSIHTRSLLLPPQYALKMMQRPIPRSTVRLTYNEICIQASTCVSSVHMR